MSANPNAYHSATTPHRIGMRQIGAYKYAV